VRPHAVVGDLDSVDPALVTRLAAEGCVVERHPTEKDASDAELAVLRALDAGADDVVLVGALAGERLDHELANLLLLADADLHERAHDLRIVRGGASVRALRGGETLALDAGIGAWVTLLPVGGDAEGVTTLGLRFPLRGETLRIGRSRGLSNVVDEDPASVSLERGVLLVVETRNGGNG
jgi:thiamine pyrophosphokinase